MTEMLTLFAAIKPPPHILRQVEDMQKGIDGVRWAPVENLHITLGYFGLVTTEYAETLDHELAKGGGGGFKISLSSVDVFGGSRPHTLWAGVQSPCPALHGLHKHIRSAARRSKIEMEARKYTPHLSLAYMHTTHGGGVMLGDLSRFIRKHLKYKSKPFVVDQFALYSSNPQKTGPNIYVKEANYPLLGR